MHLRKFTKKTKGKKSVLLLDQYPAHCSDFIKDEAKKKNIKSIYVPKGLTYKYQPLDVLINGILKQKAKKILLIKLNKKYSSIHVLVLRE